MYEMIKANHNLSADEIAFIDHELELLAKKNSAEKKPTAVQVANEGIKADILDGMEIGKKYTITDLMKEIPACAELSNQRVSALVRQLVTDGAVERTEEKRKAYFHKVA
jgi:predicted transcriptional regulator